MNMRAPNTDEAEQVDEAFMRRALDRANLNAVRLALHQITGDPALLKMRVEKQLLRGGALIADVLAPEHHETVKDRAIALLREGNIKIPPVPSVAETRQLMDNFVGEKLNDNEFRFGYEELAFDEFPRGVEWNRKPSQEVLSKFKVAIVGSGISGITWAVLLGRLGIPYQIFERQKSPGGVWVKNTYPDIRVDTNSYLYQFKFEKNYPWSEYFASQNETQKYLRNIIEKYGIGPNITYNAEVQTAQWDDGSSKWVLGIHRDDGRSETVHANVVVSAAGLFAAPRLPDIKGVDSFAGKAFHTAEWDHDFDYSGKRVAVIGNGSTGVQLLSHVAERASHVSVFQRTPQWIMGMENYRAKVDAETRWLFDTLPYYWNWFSFSAFQTADKLQGLHEHDPKWKAQGGFINERNDGMRAALTQYIRDQVQDPDLITKLTPTWAPLARRLVVDNSWYATLRRDNVELVTEGIAEITPSGIRTSDDKERGFDLIVYSTGFHTAKLFWPIKYQGRNGATVDELWAKDGPRAYLSTTMPGFPNLFVMYGPGANARAGGFYTWAESIARYGVKAVVHLLETGSGSIEVTQEAFEDFNRMFDRLNDNTVWSSDGLGGYYVTTQGRPYTNMPMRTHDFHAALFEPDYKDYDIR